MKYEEISINQRMNYREAYSNWREIMEKEFDKTQKLFLTQTFSEELWELKEETFEIRKKENDGEPMYLGFFSLADRELYFNDSLKHALSLHAFIRNEVFKFDSIKGLQGTKFFTLFKLYRTNNITAQQVIILVKKKK